MGASGLIVFFGLSAAELCETAEATRFFLGRKLVTTRLFAWQLIHFSVGDCTSALVSFASHKVHLPGKNIVLYNYIILMLVSQCAIITTDEKEEDSIHFAYCEFSEI